MKRDRCDAGFALAWLICLLAALAVIATIGVPLRVMQSKREMEKQLIFRGEEYIRAIRKYQRKYQSYPATIDDLIAREGYRFLRKQYKDPITGKDFRLIKVNADGTLTGSLTMLSIPVPTQQDGGRGTATSQISPGVAGVASESTATAVMIYNTKETYKEWEFIAPLVQTSNNGGGQPTASGASPQPGGGSNSPLVGAGVGGGGVGGGGGLSVGGGANVGVGSNSGRQGGGTRSGGGPVGTR
jgi:type II secretory pathway pseudopilin PulG